MKFQKKKKVSEEMRKFLENFTLNLGIGNLFWNSTGLLQTFPKFNVKFFKNFNLLPIFIFQNLVIFLKFSLNFPIFLRAFINFNATISHFTCVNYQQKNIKLIKAPNVHICIVNSYEFTSNLRKWSKCRMLFRKKQSNIKSK